MSLLHSFDKVYSSFFSSNLFIFTGSLVDGACQKLTASHVRAKRQYDPTIPTCDFFDNLEKMQHFSMPPGVWNMVIFF